ncbi:hypothetical protein HDU82_007385 [Entophlyctis luteolus]|nr:hypothetical protein HDU82_007385 [Entophlyctis luteolus]
MAPVKKQRPKSDFSCSICESTFSSKEGLRRHASIHNGEKPYECTYCNARFRVSYSLTLHIRTHTGEKPYECDLCGATFTQRPNLNTHMKAHAKRDKDGHRARGLAKRLTASSAPTSVVEPHGDAPTPISNREFMMTCDFCNLSGFSSKSNLDHHIQTSHAFEAFVQHEREEVSAKISASGSSSEGTTSPSPDSLVFCPNCKCSFASLERLENHSCCYTARPNLVEPFVESEYCGSKIAESAPRPPFFHGRDQQSQQYPSGPAPWEPDTDRRHSPPVKCAQMIRNQYESRSLQSAVTLPPISSLLRPEILSASGLPSLHTSHQVF